jgi:hypothetical protein
MTKEDKMKLNALAAAAAGVMSLLAVVCSAATAPPEPAKALAELKANRVEISYVAPANPAHQQIYELLKKRRVLERLQEALSPVRLPGTLTLKTEGCDGVSNAWYDVEEHTVSVCYEYIDEVMRNAPAKTTAAGVTKKDAILGPTIEVFAHETAHALFDMLRVPILGREEDAADQIAAYILLNQDKDMARKTVSGVAFMYNQEAQSQMQQLELKKFADAHGLSAQRLYNLLCMAYGADPALFKDVVGKGYLPEKRAEGCADEYRQVEYAFNTLLNPSIDQELKKKVKAKKLFKSLTEE